MAARTGARRTSCSRRRPCAASIRSCMPTRAGRRARRAGANVRGHAEVDEQRRGSAAARARERGGVEDRGSRRRRRAPPRHRLRRPQRNAPAVRPLPPRHAARFCRARRAIDDEEWVRVRRRKSARAAARHGRDADECRHVRAPADEVLQHALRGEVASDGDGYPGAGAGRAAPWRVILRPAGRAPDRRCARRARPPTPRAAGWRSRARRSVPESMPAGEQQQVLDRGLAGPGAQHTRRLARVPARGRSARGKPRRAGNEGRTAVGGRVHDLDAVAGADIEDLRGLRWARSCGRRAGNSARGTAKRATSSTPAWR